MWGIKILEENVTDLSLTNGSWLSPLTIYQILKSEMRGWEEGWKTADVRRQELSATSWDWGGKSCVWIRYGCCESRDQTPKRKEMQEMEINALLPFYFKEFVVS